jgi:hypothetical protein
MGLKLGQKNLKSVWIIIFLPSATNNSNKQYKLSSVHHKSGSLYMVSSIAWKSLPTKKRDQNS